MLRYETALPARGALRFFIRDYAQVTGFGGTSKPLMPRPGASLAIRLKGAYCAEGRPVPRAAVLGIRQRAVHVEAPAGLTDRVHVHFTPAGLSRFTAMPAARLAGRVASADELFPPRLLDRLMADLCDAGTLGERALLLDTFFEGLLRPLEPGEEAALELANRIVEAPDVPLLMREAPAGARQEERLFQRLVGVSPRALVRVARFDKARNAVLARAGEPLSGIGLDAGYYDQAHFNREFRRYASMPPGSYSFCAPPVSQRSFPARSHAT